MSAVLIWFITVLSTLSESYGLPEVQTKLGAVRGVHRRSHSGRIFSSFEGIPYAEPPVGEYRFKPVPERKPWKGVWNATYLHTCMQYHEDKVLGQEDCLYLNVYVPRENPIPGENLNVFVYIHGGGFMWGDSHTFCPPEYLMDRDLVYVSLNYRVGILGFLDTQDGAVTPNNGMRDQIVALQWLRNHISSFGGNPNSITLLGISAGAASIDLLSLSPIAKGVFDRGIVMSGSSLNPWTIQEVPAEKARYLGDLVGCRRKSTKEMVECFRDRPASELVQQMKHFYVIIGEIPFSPFAPTVERNVEGAFLPDHPLTLLENNKINDVPLLFSATTEEGIYPAVCLLDDIEENWEGLLPFLLDYNDTVPDANKIKMAKELKDKYLGGERLSPEKMADFIRLLGERQFRHGTEKSARLHAKTTKYPLYMYVLGYRSTKILHTLHTNFTDDYGVGHATELIYLFPLRALGPLTPEEEKLKDFFLDLIESYCSTGKPHLPEWAPVDLKRTEALKFLQIDSPNDMRMESAMELSDTSTWDDLYSIEREVSKNKIKDEL